MKINNPPKDSDLIKEFGDLKIGETFCLFGNNDIFLRLPKASIMLGHGCMKHYYALNLNSNEFLEINGATKVKMVESELITKYIKAE